MRGEALVAELQAELILALRAKATVALMAGTDLFVMGGFDCVNFGMNFDHGLLPHPLQWANRLPRRLIEEKRLISCRQPQIV